MTRIARSQVCMLFGSGLACALTFGFASRVVAEGPTLVLDPVTYADACDGSAAIALTPDTFVAAHDDDNVLRIYKAGVATAIAKKEFPPMPGEEDEADVEGAARIGDVIYWIASHGRGKVGQPKPARLTFFATRIVTNGTEITLEAEGQPYHALLDTFVQPLLVAAGFPKASTLAPESKDALNIEGLAAIDDHLLVAFRNPLPQGQALVAELMNPAALVANPATVAVSGRVLKVGLDGRGIRSLELVSKDKGYLLVAGPFGEAKDFDPAKPPFVVYRWPSLEAPPQAIPSLTFPKDFRPEALFLSSPSHWSVLSDDGDAEIDGVGCKDVKPKTSRRFHRATFALE